MMPKDLRRIVRGVLKYMDPTVPYSKTAEDLLMMTAATESLLGEFLYQYPAGPARGIFQMEPSSANDLWRYIDRKPKLREMMIDKFGYYKDGNSLEYLQLQEAGDLVYQIVMARLYYWRVPEPLPDAGDIPALSRYWKRYYNSAAGKGTASGARAAYKLYVEAREEEGY